MENKVFNSCKNTIPYVSIRKVEICNLTEYRKASSAQFSCSQQMLFDDYCKSEDFSESRMA